MARQVRALWHAQGPGPTPLASPAQPLVILPFELTRVELLDCLSVPRVDEQRPPVHLGSCRRILRGFTDISEQRLELPAERFLTAPSPSQPALLLLLNGPSRCGPEHVRTWPWDQHVTIRITPSSSSVGPRTPSLLQCHSILIPTCLPLVFSRFC